MKKIQYSVVSTLLPFAIVWTFLFGCSKTPDEQIQGLYGQALSQIEKFDYVEAESTISKMGEVMTSSPWIPLARGIAFEHRLEYWDALHQYRVAREAAVDFAPAYDRSARLFARLGLWEDATEEAFAYTKHKPTDSDGWLLFAKSFIGAQMFDRTHQSLSSAEEHGAPKEVTAFVAARSLFGVGEWDSSSALVASIANSAKLSAEVYVAAAEYFETAGRWDSAMVMSRRAMEMAQYDFDAVHDHFYRSLRTRHFDEARKIINRYRKQKADSMLTAGLEMLYYQASGYRLAGAQSAGFYHNIAPYVDVSPTYWDMRLREYQGDEFTGDQDVVAIEQLMKHGKWLPEFQQYMKDLVTLEVPFSMLSKTVDERLANVKFPWISRPRYKLGVARLNARWKVFEKVDTVFENLKQMQVDDHEWCALIADYYVNLAVDDWDSAAVWCDKLFREQKWRPEIFLKYVRMYDRLRQYDLAVAACDQFPQYEQHLPEIAVLRAIDEVRTGRIDEGVARFETHFPPIAGAVVYADTMLQILRKMEAVDKTQRVYDLLASPALADNVEAHMLLADQAWTSGDYRQSLNLCERAESSDPNNGFLLARKARALYGVGKKEESFALFERILLELPRTTNAYVYYSQLLATEPSQYDKAANWARAACVETDAGLTEVLNLCDIYYKVGRHDLMLGEAGKLLNIHPYDPEPPYWVGLGLYLNHRDSVKMFLDRSIALGLKGEKLQKARETISKL